MRVHTKKFDVVVVGELNVDLILSGVSNQPKPDKEIVASEMEFTTGSSSAIFAHNLSVLGSKVAFIGNRGNDYYGEFIINRLKKGKVDTSNISKINAHATGITVALNYGETRAMITYPGSMAHFSFDDINFDFVRKARHLHVSSVFLQKDLKKDIVLLFKKVKHLGLTTSLDPQWDPDEKWDIDFKNLLPHVDIFMPNASELKSITRTSDVSKAAKILNCPNLLVVKDGRNGSRIYSKGKDFRQSSFLHSHVVDTIGAGDSFNAGFIHQYINNKSIEECARLAALTGAISTTRYGGTDAFDSLANVKKIALAIFNATL